ncbi:MAG: alkaline phosphatase family protein [Candidatus Electrothrix sp. GW3-4]|uniref:alkaline phosphatase family protein n=1 Tax=Candidatus Electrothrix sp. GW3-4 TaxID=3126740 RepID=UPI0030CD3A5A
MKLYVIGIDGATYRVIQPLLAAGKLPHIQRIMSEGGSGRLMSTVPPLSPVAWTTITTGAKPSSHGITEFLAHDKTTKNNFLFDASHRKVDPIWTVAGSVGKRSCVINVPLTYPVDHLNGFMISGLGTPPTQNGHAYPMEDFEEMKQAIGRYDIDINFLKNKKKTKIAESLRQVTQGRRRCFNFLLDREPWDLFFFVFTNTDRAQHFFWQEYEETNGPLADMIPYCYQEADRAVGQVMERAEAEEGMVMIVSDHGFGPLNNSFSLSNWLHDKGLLTSTGTKVRENPLKKTAKKIIPDQLIKVLLSTIFKNRWKFTGPSADLDKWIDWEKTKIYSHKKIDTVFLFTNDEAFSNAAERAAVIRQLRKDMLAVTDPSTGENIILDLVDGNLLFGEDKATTPDLVLIPANGYNFSFDSQDIERENPFVGIPRLWSGNHESEGVFMAWGKHINAGTEYGELSIMDVMPTMCYILDLPIPSWAEGKVVRQAFSESFLDTRKERRESPPSDANFRDSASAGAMNEVESEEVIKRLKALGYL